METLALIILMILLQQQTTVCVCIVSRGQFGISSECVPFYDKRFVALFRCVQI